MSYATFFPEQRYAAPLATIRREVVLPEGVVGDVNVNAGARVAPGDVVARGTRPSRHVIVDVMGFFRLRRPEEVERLLLVEIGDPVEEGQPLAGRNAARARRIVSPVTGDVIALDGGRLVLRDLPQTIDLDAGMQGRVVETLPGRGVVIEGTGAVVQGLWGNQRRAVGVLRHEPVEGLENVTLGTLERDFIGAIVVTRRPLREGGLFMAEANGIGGVVAPSMDATLLAAARAADLAILLTEGFGEHRMSTPVAQLLEQHVGHQAALDASQPNRLEARRPEVIIQVKVRSDERPAALRALRALKVGMAVRLIRDPYQGQVGTVAALPSAPQQLANGLVVPTVHIELTGGERLVVPLANVEVYGR